MPRRKAEPTTIPMDWAHANPDFQGREIPMDLPVTKGSTNSIHWKDLTPLWLLREYLNRNNYGGMQNRIASVKLVDGAYEFRCNLNSPKTEPTWKTVSIPQQEVEAEE